MIFSGLELKKKVPFTDVFINGTILAKDGRRMSKSLGTGIDPLNYIGPAWSGRDALRAHLAGLRPGYPMGRSRRYGRTEILQ